MIWAVPLNPYVVFTVFDDICVLTVLKVYSREFMSHLPLTYILLHLVTAGWGGSLGSPLRLCWLQGAEGLDALLLLPCGLH